MDRLLLCTDLDRTLIPNGAQPESDRARPLFARLIALPQVRLVYVSGRDTGRVDRAISEWNLPEPDLVIADVGTTIANRDQTSWVRWTDWDARLATDWEGLTPSDLQQELQSLPELVLQDSSRQGRFKLSYDTPAGPEGPALAEVVRQKLTGTGLRTNVIWSLDEPLNKGLLDILPQAATKRLAIEHVLERWDYRGDEVMFAGDSGNDLAVLVSPIAAVLVANACSEIKAMAVDQARSQGLGNKLHCATGGPWAMNGNYAAGILEGVLHFFPHLAGLMGDPA